MAHFLQKITGQVIGHFNAFKGSRPAYNTEKTLIVRGVSQDKIAIEDMGEKLAELKDILGAQEVDPQSDEGIEFINNIDSHIRENMEIDTAPDTSGISKMKEELESMGLHVEYKLYLMKHAGAFIAIWKDKSGFGPLYVEVTVTDLDQ